MIGKWLAKDEQGFTLVELMMVIVILAILTGVAVPMVSRIQRNAWAAKLTSLADSLGSAIVVDAMMATDEERDGSFYAGEALEGKPFDDLMKALVAMPKDVAVVQGTTAGEAADAKAYLVVEEDATDAKAVMIKGYRKGKTTDQLLADDGMVFSWAEAIAE
jgi:prepilin-type N-terminal cleavage/methylation domain-containing protein